MISGNKLAVCGSRVADVDYKNVRTGKANVKNIRWAFVLTLSGSRKPRHEAKREAESKGTKTKISNRRKIDENIVH